MKKLISLLFTLQSLFGYSQQIKVAIVDFENTSGIAKYDGLGKAMSSMLISDIEANVSPKRLQLVERSQINKILKEQNFQKTSSVDKASTVKMGKLLGVKYLLVGDIFVLNDALVINARLVDTETGDIKFSKKQEGKLVGWLSLKTNIARQLATNIAIPFTEPNIPDADLNIATVTTFGNALVEKDKGNIDKAEVIVSTVKDFDPNFKYADELNNEIKEIKERLSKLETDVSEAVENPYIIALDKIDHNEFEIAIKYLQLSERKIYKKEKFENNKKLFINALLGISYYRQKNYLKAKEHLLIANEIYPWLQINNIYYILTLLKLDKKDIALEYYLEYQKNVSYWQNDMERVSNGKIETTQGVVDGFGRLTNDVYGIGSRSEFASFLQNEMESENLNLGVNVLEIEYYNYLNQFKKNNVDKQIVVNYNYEKINRYFNLVNSYVWFLMKDKKDYNLAKSILTENLSLIYNIKIPETESETTDYYKNKDNYKIDLGNNGGELSKTLETLTYLIGNLLNCFAASGDIEKAKVLYCDLLQDGLIWNKANDNRLIVGRMLPPDGNEKNQQKNVSNILRTDFTTLDISSTILNDIEKCDCNKYSKDWYQLLEFGKL